MVVAATRKEYIAYYWACNVDSHRHKTEVVANKCIAKHLGGKTEIKWTPENSFSLSVAILSGRTYKQAGAMFSVGAARARDQFYKCIRKSNFRAKRMGKDELVIDSQGGIKALRENRENIIASISEVMRCGKILDN